MWGPGPPPGRQSNCAQHPLVCLAGCWEFPWFSLRSSLFPDLMSSFIFSFSLNRFQGWLMSGGFSLRAKLGQARGTFLAISSSQVPGVSSVEVSGIQRHTGLQGLFYFSFFVHPRWHSCFQMSFCFLENGSCGASEEIIRLRNIFIA